MEKATEAKDAEFNWHEQVGENINNSTRKQVLLCSDLVSLMGVSSDALSSPMGERSGMTLGLISSTMFRVN